MVYGTLGMLLLKAMSLQEFLLPAPRVHREFKDLLARRERRVNAEKQVRRDRLALRDPQDRREKLDQGESRENRAYRAFRVRKVHKALRETLLPMTILQKNSFKALSDLKEILVRKVLLVSKDLLAPKAKKAMLAMFSHRLSTTLATCLGVTTEISRILKQRTSEALRVFREFRASRVRRVRLVRQDPRARKVTPGLDWKLKAHTTLRNS